MMLFPARTIRRTRDAQMTRILLTASTLVFAAAVTAAVVSTDNLSPFGTPPDTERRVAMRASSQFDGKRFHNPIPTRLGAGAAGYLDMINRYLFGGQTRVPKKSLPTATPDATRRAEPPAGGLRVTWLGHSSVLIEIDGRRVLTDPVWSRRASPSILLGPARFHPPPLRLDELPELDAVIISHDHYDHLDKAAVLSLARTGVRFHVPLGVGAHLERWGVARAQVTEMDWWKASRVANGALTITATPARHFSGRGLMDRDATLWASWVLAGPRHRVFFSGDTGPFAGFGEIGAAFGPFDLTLIENGAYDRTWPDLHLSPEQVVDAHLALGGTVLLPIHWGTFNLAIHDWFEPPERLLRAARERDIRLALPLPGEPVELDLLGSPSPWWRRGRQGVPNDADLSSALALQPGELSER